MEHDGRQTNAVAQGNDQQPDDAGEDEGRNHKAKEELFVALVHLGGNFALCLGLDKRQNVTGEGGRRGA